MAFIREKYVLSSMFAYMEKVDRSYRITFKHRFYPMLGGLGVRFGGIKWLAILAATDLGSALRGAKMRMPDGVLCGNVWECARRRRSLCAAPRTDHELERGQLFASAGQRR